MAATALIVMGIGTVIGVAGNIMSGIEEKKLADEQAEHNEDIAEAQYGLAKTEGTAQLEQLRDEEVKAKSSLLQGAASAGVKIERDEIQDVGRTDINTLITDMENESDYRGGKPTKPRNTIEALSNDISRQITDTEKGVMRNLSNAKLGLDDALFNAQMLREKGDLSQIAGWFNAGSTLLTGAANMYGAKKSWGNW